MVAYFTAAISVLFPVVDHKAASAENAYNHVGRGGILPIHPVVFLPGVGERVTHR